MEQKPHISFDDYLKLDIRICHVVAAEHVPKTDKLLKLTINTGTEERTAVTNLGSKYEPEYFVDQFLPFLLNLEPVTIKGIESRAMIIAASNENNVELLKTIAPIGSVVI